MNEVYNIPSNFTDAGKLFGAFAIRNVIEALVLAVPMFFLLFSILPFGLTANIIITHVVTMPVGGFALIGLNDDCLSRFVRIWWRWRRNRAVLTYRGTPQ